MGSLKESFPPEPTQHLDWSNLGVGIARDVNGYIESKWTAETQLWSEPMFVKSSKIEMHGLSSALNYGMQAYEGMKAIRDSSGQIRIFRPEKHAARFRHSCDCVSIPPISDDHFVRCVSLAVSLNAEFVPPHGAPAMLYVRPLALGTGAQVNIIPPSDFSFYVFVIPSAALLGASKPAAALILDDFDRAAPNGTGSAKIGGNYAPVMKWQRKAKQEGFAITLHLDSQTRSYIEEFSAAGFVGVIKGTGSSSEGYTLVVPESTSVINSVTSDTCLELARDLGWKVEIRPVRYDELRNFDEVLAVGTAAIVVPIQSITRYATASSPANTTVYNCDVTGKSCFNLLFGKIMEAQTGALAGGSAKKWGVVVKEVASYGFEDLDPSPLR